MDGLHIKRPVNPRFVARVRLCGYRKYLIVGRNYRSEEAASIAMVKEFARRSDYKRGDVLMCEHWYEPNQMLEITR